VDAVQPSEYIGIGQLQLFSRFCRNQPIAFAGDVQEFVLSLVLQAVSKLT
jgi:hypothetical protein